MKAKSYRCVECGKGTVRPVARPGRTMQHRTMLLKVPAKLRIPTCDQCGEEWIDEGTSRLIDEVLEQEYRRRLSVIVQRSLGTLGQHATLKEQRLLGLSHGCCT